MKSSTTTFNWAFIVKNSYDDTFSQAVMNQLQKRLLIFVSSFVIPNLLVFLSKLFSVDSASDAQENLQELLDNTVVIIGEGFS